MARRFAADLSRRPRLRLQVEHGLDARHARLSEARPDPPPLPPQRADLQHDVRLQRELHPAALPRRGRPRQGLALREDGGRPLAEAREPARPLRLHVGAPGQEAPVHGRRVRAALRVAPRRVAALAPARAPRPRGRDQARSRHQPHLPRRAGAVGARLRPRRLLLADRRRSRQQRVRVRADGARGRAAARLRLQLLAGRAGRVPARAAARRTLGGSSSTPTPATTRGRMSATAVVSMPSRRRGTASRPASS